MYKPLADSTLMGMTKKEIIEQLRIAEHNFKAMEETVNQQAENFIKLLEEERKHGHWINGYKCSVCGMHRAIDNGAYRIGTKDNKYCFRCGATMDEVVKNENSM